MNKSVLIFGTRPELIKLIPVINEFKKRGIRNRLIVINTNQHNNLLQYLIDFFHVDIDYTLNINNTSNNLSILTAQIISELELAVQHISANHNINAFIVQGDTSTTYCSSLVAFYNKISIHYIEAGLRTYNMSKPFPEEFYRRTISHTASFFYAPTESSKTNLVNEGINSRQVIVSGNTIIDILKYMDDHLEKSNDINESRVVLCTIHRRENHGEKFNHYYKSIINLAKEHVDIKFIIIKHPNPNIGSVIENTTYELPENIVISSPVNYDTMLNLINQSCLIISDSGGLQEEASYYLKPMIVLRDITERTESIINQIAICHTGKQPFEVLFRNMIDLNIDPRNKYLYGKGKASEIIVDKIIQETNL